MTKTYPARWPVSIRDSRDITDLLNQPIARLRLIESETSVDLEITYDPTGEIMTVPVAAGCGCCGSPWIPEES